MVCFSELVVLWTHLPPPLRHLLAINSLHGRFFAKRQVEAIFFDEERWERGDLASHPDEY